MVIGDLSFGRVTGLLIAITIYQRSDTKEEQKASP